MLKKKNNVSYKGNSKSQFSYKLLGLRLFIQNLKKSRLNKKLVSGKAG